MTAQTARAGDTGDVRGSGDVRDSGGSGGVRNSGEVDGLTRAEQACVDGESALERGDTVAAEKHFGVALGSVDPAEGDASDEGGGGASEGGARVVARARTGAGRVLLARGDVGAAEAEFARASGLRHGHGDGEEHERKHARGAGVEVLEAHLVDELG
ncbi:hypothetical protein ABZ369_33445, partial [Streptomyces sp. NPDC005918]|uniref:hypothetical protein n=1 Tax=Streptomyces sp. NPDC005918 TaxID=3155454 RepID=UPI0033E92826